MSEMDRYGYDSRSHPSHQQPRAGRSGRDWLVLLLILAAAVASWGCMHLGGWMDSDGHGVPPTTTTTTTTTTTPPAPPPPHPCADCLAKGLELCNQAPKYLKTGCCNQPPGEACYEIPAAPAVDCRTTGCPEHQVCEHYEAYAGGYTCMARPLCAGDAVECWALEGDEWVWRAAPAMPTPTPPQPGNCGVEMPNEPVRVDRPPVGVPKIGGPGRWMAKSACLSTAPIAPGVGGNGSCFGRNLAEGIPQSFIDNLEKPECFWGRGIGYSECYCYDAKPRVIDAGNMVVNRDGYLVDVNFDASTGDTAIDFWGRAVSYRGGTPHLIAWIDQDGTQLAPPSESWMRGDNLCPPLVWRACPEPPPATPTPTRPPPGPPVDGMGITIAIRCAGTSPNCGVHEVTGQDVNTGRVFRAPLKATSQAFHIDASYFLNRRSNKVHYFPPDDPSYDPRWPGPLVSWAEEILFGDHVDTSDFHDHPQGMTITARGIRYAEGDDEGYKHGTRNRWTACNAQGLCGTVTLEVLP